MKIEFNPVRMCWESGLSGIGILAFGVLIGHIVCLNAFSCCLVGYGLVLLGISTYLFKRY